MYFAFFVASLSCLVRIKFSLLVLPAPMLCIRQETFCRCSIGPAVWDSLPLFLWIVSVFQIWPQNPLLWEVSCLIKGTVQLTACLSHYSSSSSRHSAHVCHGVTCLLMLMFVDSWLVCCLLRLALTWEIHFTNAFIIINDFCEKYKDDKYFCIQIGLKNVQATSALTNVICSCLLCVCVCTGMFT